MALRVKCPNGCLLRVPENRVGEIIRCPKCKTTLQVKEIPTNPGTIVASVFVDERNDVQINTDGPQRIADDLVEVLIAPSIKPDAVSSQPDKLQLANRVTRAKNDRILVSRFIACFIIAVGCVNIAPAAYHWYLWSLDPIAVELPKWTYIQIFIASLHILYAIFVLQIGDWSSLKAVSVVMLAFGGWFGFVSAGLLLGGHDSPMADFLGLNFSMIKTATIWCVSMLLLAIISCYITGKEAMNWKRIDQIMLGIHELPGDTK